MSVFATARHIYASLRNDPDAMDAVRAERARLAMELVTDPAAGTRITSSTVNGQSFGANIAGVMTITQRLSMLSIICQFDDMGRPMGAQTRAILT